MPKYEFARIKSNNTVVCTNVSLLENLAQELENLPIEKNLELPLLAGKKLSVRGGINDKYEIQIFGVVFKDEFRWWLLKWFVDKGWEPFSHFEDVYSFRRSVE